MTFNPIKTIFKSLALAVVVGAMGFFAGNFLTIIGLGVYGSLTHHTPDFSLAYRRGARYLCDGLRKEFAEPMCASVSGTSIDAAVIRAFLEALQPAPLDALEALLRSLEVPDAS